MKIYVAHSREFDYENDLYYPIRTNPEFKNFDFILPHESGQAHQWGREFYGTLDLIIAEVSFPSTGQGIELGWANDSHVPIVCISKHDAKVSSSLHAVTNQFYEYDNAEELRHIIKQAIAHTHNLL